MSTAETAVKIPPEQPPTTSVAAAAERAPGTVCPESQSPCLNGCKLPEGTGSCYCARWVARVRSEAIAEKN